MYANDMSLSLKSETFSAMKEDFDSILARTIGNMEMKGAEEAGCFSWAFPWKRAA